MLLLFAGICLGIIIGASSMIAIGAYMSHRIDTSTIDDGDIKELWDKMTTDIAKKLVDEQRRTT